ncbi:DUF5788 family protein [Halarchaeum nitratireducens]|uniref:Uncharacterized protein n=1 Tax=Halarchaeum nitratireducens TaxID=489913 RepID=A0A830GB04_9EURY|nr:MULTISPECIES: DUF5788 family protein [Halarchaeum]MBP2251496.1 hypothetical protein [Halarchaeum solikamskense]GGN14471.1 hypothetical protein GCM10009021_13430 [Halarchaeum nitratireducens]
MKEYERKGLLERIGRESATVGATIPDEIALSGESFPLREFVFETSGLDRIPPERREEVEDAKRTLRRARRERVERLEEAEIDYAEGETLADEVIGIDRALNALESLDTADIEREIEAKEAADTKRWHTFLKKALGRDDDGSRGRGRGRGNGVGGAGHGGGRR